MSHLSLKRAEKSIENVNEFKQLYEDHKKNVFAMALSILRDFELAEDVLQEVFIKFFQYTQHKEVSNAKAWLISVARNTALDLYRKKKRELIGFDEGYFERIPYLAEDPLDRMVLSKYLELLDDVERKIVILKDISGLKHREIGSVLDIPLGTVIWKYRKALSKLKKGLEKEEF